MDSLNLITEEEMLKKVFSKIPSIKDVIKYIAESNPRLMDNDRDFCYIFDQIMLNNGLNEMSLPSYWSIGREIFRYKKEHNLKADTKTNQLNYAIKILNLGKYNIKLQVTEGKKPTTAKIIEAIWINYNNAFQNDRLLVKIFDSIALNNGFMPEELPKYWNIIRAAFDYKKDKEFKPNIDNSEFTDKPNNINCSEPIDYRIMNAKIDILNLSVIIHNKLVRLGIRTISELLEQLKIGSIDYLNRKKDVIYEVLSNFDIKEGIYYYPAVMATPDIYSKKLSFLFNNEIIRFLSKYNYKNIGLFANKFPDVIIEDDAAMENPKVFEYIDRITEVLKNHGISTLPIKLSKFQIDD